MIPRPFKLGFVDPGILKAPFFLELKSHLEPDIACVYYSRRRLVRGYARSSGTPILPEQSAVPGQAGLSNEELVDAIGLKEWSLRGTTAVQRAERCLADLTYFFDTAKPDAILVWNGSNLRLSLAVYIARKRGIRIIFAEHGYFPGTLQLDLQGVNQLSSLTGLVRAGAARLGFDARIDTDLDCLIAKLRAGQTSRVVRQRIPEKFLGIAWVNLANQAFYRFRPLGLAKPLFTAPIDPELPEHFVFVPLQVRDDSQLILHSPIFGNDIEAMLGAIQMELSTLDATLKLVVKFHPLEKRSQEKRNRALMERFPDIVFVRSTPAAQIIGQARAVVTINSSVGFEAVMMDKPVVTLGRNFYTFPGIVEAVETRNGLRDALASALHNQPDTAYRREFLRFVLANFATPGTYFDHRPASYSSVVHKIRELLSADDPPRRELSEPGFAVPVPEAEALALH